MLDSERAAISGEPEPPPPKPASTPCHVCPKHKLFPSNWGLNPANELAVEIYRHCEEEQRVGTFEGAALVRTITVSGLKLMLDEYEPFFAHWLDRHNTMKKVLAIDRVATQKRFDEEERVRAAQRNKK